MQKPLSQQKRLYLPSGKQGPGEILTVKDSGELTFAFNSKLKIGKANDLEAPGVLSRVKLSQQQPVRTTEDLGTTPDWVIGRESGQNVRERITTTDRDSLIVFSPPSPGPGRDSLSLPNFSQSQIRVAEFYELTEELDRWDSDEAQNDASQCGGVYLPSVGEPSSQWRHIADNACFVDSECERSLRLSSYVGEPCALNFWLSDQMRAERRCRSAAHKPRLTTL